MSKVNKPSKRHGFVNRVVQLLLAVGFGVLCVLPGVARAADSAVNVQVCPGSPYPAPSITSPTNGTNTTNSSIVMSGQATADVTVYIYRNSAQVGFVTADSGGIFSTSVSLAMGSNVLQASTNNDCSTPTFSNSVTVVRKSPPGPPSSPTPSAEPSDPPQTETETPPAESPTGNEQPGENAPGDETPAVELPSDPAQPVITEPRTGTRVTEPFVMLKGRAAPNTPVRVLRDGEVVAQVLTNDEGWFSVRVSLHEGENHLTITTGRGQSMRTSSEAVVTYEPKAAMSTVKWVIIAFAGVTISGIALYIAWQLGLPGGIRRLFAIRRKQ